MQTLRRGTRTGPTGGLPTTKPPRRRFLVGIRASTSSAVAGAAGEFDVAAVETAGGELGVRLSTVAARATSGWGVERFAVATQESLGR